MTKKQLSLRIRQPAFLNGNLFLINQIIENYLSIHELVQLMRVNYATYQVLRYRNQRYWFNYYRLCRFKPLGENYIHLGPLRYGCLTNKFREKGLKIYQTYRQKIEPKIVSSPNDPLQPEDFELIYQLAIKDWGGNPITEWYAILLESQKQILDYPEQKYVGYFSDNFRYTALADTVFKCGYFNYSYSKEFNDGYHWISKNRYSEKYYQKFDPQTDYIKRMKSELFDLKKLKKDLTVKTRVYQNKKRVYEREIGWANYSLISMKEYEKKIETLKNRLEILNEID